MTKERALLARLVAATPSFLCCEDFDHKKGERHDSGEQCKPNDRFQSAMDDARALLAEPEVPPLTRAETEAMVATLVDAVQMTEGYAGGLGADTKANWLRWLEKQADARAAVLAEFATLEADTGYYWNLATKMKIALDALRAEVEASAKAVEALVPLARLGLELVRELKETDNLIGDDVDAQVIGRLEGRIRDYGVASYVELEDTELTKQARALLAARKGEG